ncbi:MAG: PEP-CTERM sorting domain-containing protein, partial [Planctomycetota bacterium]
SGPLAGQNILSLSTASFALAVNGQGSILLEANVDQVGGLYTQDGLVVANGVIDGVDGFFFGAADLNDNGTYISNFSDFNTFNNGIVVDGQLLITDLDTIEGFDIDVLLNGGPIDLNNAGDFVFVASLLDSNGDDFEAVIRATLVPEPTSLALLGLGGLLITRRRRRTR